MASKKSGKAAAPATGKKNPAQNPVPPNWNSFFHSTKGVFLLGAILFGMVLWTFWPSLKGQYFFHDDFGYFICNTHINTGLSWANVHWAFVALDDDQWLPLTWISHMVDVQIFGNDPWGHHLVSVLLHAASAVLVFLLLKKLTGAQWRSLIVAALFAVHPMRSESVAWICERKDVLSVFFGLFALIFYAEYVARLNLHRKKIWFFYALTFAFFALSLLSKQTLTCFGALLLLLDFWPLNRWKSGNVTRLILEKIPFFIVVPFVNKLSYLALLRGGSLKGMAFLGWDAKFENALVSYARYLAHFFYPLDIHPWYSHPEYWPGALVCFSGILIVAICVFAWVTRRDFPFFFVGWFWFFGTLLQVIGFLQLYEIAMADRYTYVPSIGLTLALVWAFYEITKRWKNQIAIGGTLAVLLVLISIAWTRTDLKYWQDEKANLEHITATDPGDYVAHYLLAFIMSNAWEFENTPATADEALRQYQISADLAPHYYEAQRDLGFCLLRHGRPREAIMHFQACLNYVPEESPFGLGLAYFQIGKTNEGIELCQKAYAPDTNNMQIVNNLGMMLVQDNRPAEAIPFFKKIAGTNPNDPNVWNNLGIVAARAGKFDDSIAAFQNALKLAPDSADLQNNLAATLRAQQNAAQTNSTAH